MPICEASGHEIWPASLPVTAVDLTYSTARKLSVRCGLFGCGGTSLRAASYAGRQSGAQGRHVAKVRAVL